MLVLLPPSEGKTAPASGHPVSLGRLSHPELADARRRVGDALVKVSGTRGATQKLGVGATLGGEVARNTTLWANPAAPAAHVYTGVLYDAAGMAAWDGPTLARAASRVRIISALWGAVSPADAIPAYRLSMGTALPRLGGLASFWGARLDDALAPLAADGIVVDCRSGAYVPAWRPAGPWVAVKVLREAAGTRSVVSHMAKHTRGLLAAHLARLAETPTTASDVADAAAGMIGDALVDVSLEARDKGPDELSLVIAG